MVGTAPQDWRVQTADHGQYLHPDSRWSIDDAGTLFFVREDRIVAVYATGVWLFVRLKNEVIHG